MKKTILLATCALATLSAAAAGGGIDRAAEVAVLGQIERVVDVAMCGMRVQAFEVEDEITKKFKEDIKIARVDLKIIDNERLELVKKRNEMWNSLQKIREQNPYWNAELGKLLFNAWQEAQDNDDKLKPQIAACEKKEEAIKEKIRQFEIDAQRAVNAAMLGRYAMFVGIREELLLGVLSGQIDRESFVAAAGAA